MRKRLRLRHVAGLVAGAGGIASGLAILVLSALVDKQTRHIEALTQLHADTRARVLGREVVDEAADVVAVRAHNEDEGGPG